MSNNFRIKVDLRDLNKTFLRIQNTRDLIDHIQIDTINIIINS